MSTKALIGCNQRFIYGPAFGIMEAINDRKGMDRP